MSGSAVAIVRPPVLKPAAGYVRESTEEQGQGFSPEMQRKAIKRWAADHGCEVVEWYVDYISGREAEKRGDFKRLIDDARDDRFEAVIAFHTSRFARNAQEAQIYKNLLRKKLGIAVEFATQHFGDPNDPSAWLNERPNEVIDEHLSINISFWVSNGLKEKKEQGYLIGSLPFGYRRPAPDNTKDAEPDPEEAPIVREIFERYASGTETYGTIATSLNARGLRGRRSKTWSKDTVRELLINATYAGYISPRRAQLEDCVKGGFEAIVSDELWLRARSIRERHHHSTHGTRPSKRDYVLSGLAICGACGDRLHGKTTGRATSRVPRYACAGRTKRSMCQECFAPAARLEREVAEFFSSFRLDHPAIRAEVLTRAAAAWNTAVREVPVDAVSVERRLARLCDLYEFGDITQGDYVTKRAQLARLLATAQPTKSLDRERCVALLRAHDSVCEGAGDVM